MEYMMIFRETTGDAARREDPKEAPAYWAAWQAYVAQLQSSGAVRGGNGLQAPHTGTTLRVQGGKRLVQDGPHPDAKEHLGGYFIVDVASLDVALDWAAIAPCVTTGSVEVRPVLPPPPA
ncbi:MAG: hypothetical protein JST00_32735 [Deltaproteobacteria bacterium]|nr:hypothetical protein [Deltaproteobacteria bacterium]